MFLFQPIDILYFISTVYHKFDAFMEKICNKFIFAVNENFWVILAVALIIGPGVWVLRRKYRSGFSDPKILEEMTEDGAYNIPGGTLMLVLFLFPLLYFYLGGGRPIAESFWMLEYFAIFTFSENYRDAFPKVRAVLYQIKDDREMLIEENIDRLKEPDEKRDPQVLEKLDFVDLLEGIQAPLSDARGYFVPLVDKEDYEFEDINEIRIPFSYAKTRERLLPFSEDLLANQPEDSHHLFAKSAKELELSRKQIWQGTGKTLAQFHPIKEPSEP